MPIQLPCPSCQRQLRVPENLIGKMVQCPSCQTSFEANDGPAPARQDSLRAEPPARRRDDRYEAYREEPRVRRFSRSDRDDDDDYDDDRPRRRRRRANYDPHRGIMILVFGILSWAVCPVFGLVAWILGHHDLKEMRAGRMDPEGESLTNIGRILGLIHVILASVAIALYCGFFILMSAPAPHK